MTIEELAAIRAAPADVTFRDVLALVAEVERLRAALREIHTIAKDGLSGGDDYEAMREIEMLSGGD